jgi:hypothetical protein
MIFRKLLLKKFYVCLLLKKVDGKYFLVNRKHLLVKGKFSLIFKKVFFFYFGQKTLSKNCEQIRNIILFIDYIKFNP